MVTLYFTYCPSQDVNVKKMVHRYFILFLKLNKFPKTSHFQQILLKRKYVVNLWTTAVDLVQDSECGID